MLWNWMRQCKLFNLWPGMPRSEDWSCWSRPCHIHCRGHKDESESMRSPDPHLPLWSLPLYRDTISWNWPEKQRTTNQQKEVKLHPPTSEATMNLKLRSTSILMLPLTHHPVPVESKPSVTHMMVTVRQTRNTLPLLAFGAAVNHPWDLLSPEMTQTKYPMTEKRMTEARWRPFVHSTTKNNVAMGYQAKDVQEPIPLSALNWCTLGTKVPGDVQRVRIAIVFILKCFPHPSAMVNASMTHAACTLWKALADWTHAHTLRSRAVGTNRMLGIKGMTEIYQPSPHLEVLRVWKQEMLDAVVQKIQEARERPALPIQMQYSYIPHPAPGPLFYLISWVK